MGEIRLFKSHTEWKCQIETTARKSLLTISISTLVNLSTCLSIDCVQPRPIAVSFYYPCKSSEKRMINCYNITMLNTGENQGKATDRNGRHTEFNVDEYHQSSAVMET